MSTVMALAMVASLLLGLPSGGPAAAAETGTVRSQVGTTEVVRYAGTNRMDTARLLATDDAVDAPGFAGETVLLARADAFPDSLAGSYLAGALQAPVLLTPSDQLTPEVTDALTALAPANVVILGGDAAVSQGVADQLAIDYTVVRVAGAGRYETAARIARHTAATAHDGLALMASGDDFPDALTAGAVAAGERIPMLLTSRDVLPEATISALEDLAITEVVLAGGTAAVSQTVEDRIEQLGITVTRVAGTNRFDTARRIAEMTRTRFGWRTDHVNLTSGLRFPDAVTLAAHAGLEAGGAAPILLTADVVPASTASALADYAACDFASVHVAGGTAAVPDAVADQAVGLLRPDGCAPDDVPPTVAFTSPDDGVTIQRTQHGVRLTGTASDADSGVRTVEIEVDGVVRGATVGDRSTDPVQWSLDLTPPQNRTYTFTAIATDGAGNTATDELTLTIEDLPPGDTVVDDDVQVIGAGDDLDAVDEDGLLFGSPPGDPILPGEVLVGGALPAAPQGLLRRVVTAEEDDQGRLVVVTAPATLTDVFLQADIEFESPIDPGDASNIETTDGVSIGVNPDPTPELPGSDKVPAEEQPVQEGPRGDFPSFASSSTFPTASGARTPAAKEPALEVSKRFEENWEATFDKSFINDTLTVRGTNTFGIWLSFGLRIKSEWSWSGVRVWVDVFKVVAGADETLEVAVEASADLSFEETVRLGKIELPPITFAIGPVPVVLTTDLTLDLALSAGIQGEASTSASASISVSAGVIYTDEDKWDTISTFERDFTVEPLTFSASAEAEAALEAGLSAALYDAASVRIITGPYVRAEAATDRNPLWALYGGFRGTIRYSVQIPVIDKELGGTEQELFDLQFDLATAEDFPDHTPTPPPIVDPVVQITSPTAGTIGCCDVLLRSDPWSPQENQTNYSTDWSSNIDGDLGQTRNRQPLRATLTPGTHTITAELYARNSDGDLVTVTDTVQITVDSNRRSGQLRIVETVSGDDAGAAALAQALSGDDPLLVGAQWLLAPPADGFAAVVADAPGFPRGPSVAKGSPLSDNRAVLLTNGLAEDAITTFDLTESGTDLGGAAPSTDRASTRDVASLALHLDVPEHANCAVLDHRFLTEEVPRFVGSEYNDALIIERFDATFKDNGTVVLGDAQRWTADGSEITSPLNHAFGPEQLQVRVNAATSEFIAPSAAFETKYTQAYPRMRAAIRLTPGATQTLVISLFDQGDGVYDSAAILDGLEILSVDDPVTECVGGIAPGGLSLSPTATGP